jgi:hypothetical protein
MTPHDHDSRNHLCTAKRCLDFTVKVGDKKGGPINRMDYNAEYRLKHSGIKVCDCGAQCKQLSFYAHLKSKRHMDYLKSIE